MRFGLGEHIIKQINTIFSQHPEIEQALIYGSRAKGNYKTGSDIDLCLFGNTLNQKHLTKINQQLDDSTIPYQIDLSIHHTIDNPKFLDHITRIGQKFYIMS